MPNIAGQIKINIFKWCTNIWLLFYLGIAVLDIAAQPTRKDATFASD